MNSPARHLFGNGSRGCFTRVAATLAIGVLTGSLALAAPTGDPEDEPQAPVRFTHLDLKTTGFAGTFRPASAASAAVASVIVRLAGSSVGEERATALKQGRDLSRAEKDIIRSALKGKQDRVGASIGALGGTVTDQFQDAYNGVAAEVPANALPSLAALPDVEAIYLTRTVKPDNVAGGQYIGANAAWGNLGLSGDGVKIAVIDTGIDYYHANFGGTDGKAKFAADNGTAIEDGSFPTAKVAGGFDFVGDAYDSQSDVAANRTPRADPDPLDCNGHGSHTAGTAAGFGVLADGTTFSGTYDANTYAANSFTIGPGVAPKASIYAYRVFGCAGSATDAIIVAAINRAVLDDVDVISMSLGSVFGRDDAPDAVAANIAAAGGIVVVASAGNSGTNGTNAYVTGAPAAATRVLSVAALDASSPAFPGATIPLSTGPTITAQLSNGRFQGDAGADLPTGALEIKVLTDANGNLSLGCDAADYAGVEGKLVVVLRGTCARVHKAILGQKAGASAVAMINNSPGFPNFEGDITSDPDTGESIHVTIPFFGVRGFGGGPDAQNLRAANGGSANRFDAATVPNPTYRSAATFSSPGPRNVDSAVKPEVIAPGVSVKSTAAGTGNQGTRISGTSMSAPFTSGLAALVREAHPAWTTEAIKAAIINTANASSSAIVNYNPRIAGAGVIQAAKAVDTVAYATTGVEGKDTLSFGYKALGGAFSQTLPVTLHNTSASDITYNLSVSVTGNQLGTVVSVSPSSVTVPAGSARAVDATATMSAAAVAALPGAEVSNFGSIVTVRGAVIATPTTNGTAGIYALRVPYNFVPRGASSISAGSRSAYTRTGGTSTATVPLSNAGIHAGNADVYAWGIRDTDDVTGAEDSMDVRDVGVQALPRGALCRSTPAGACGTADDRSLVFAINTYGRASNPGVNEFDIIIDLQGNGKPDYYVIGVDFGAVTTGVFDGRYASFIFDKAFNFIDAWVADAPMNGSTILLPALASQIGLNPDVNSTRFRYAVQAFSIVPGALVDTTAFGSFRSHEPPVSSGDFIPLAPGASATLTVSVDRGKFAGTPQLGWLVVGLDDANGAAQADEVAVGSP